MYFILVTIWKWYYTVRFFRKRLIKDGVSGVSDGTSTSKDLSDGTSTGTDGTSISKDLSDGTSDGTSDSRKMSKLVKRLWVVLTITCDANKLMLQLFLVFLQN